MVCVAKANEHGEPVELDAAGHPVEITSPEKVMFPEPGITKLDLAHYYLAVEEPIMRTVRDRPTLLQRFPNGVTGSNFFQKRIPDSAPEWLQTTIVTTPNGTTSRAIVMADIAHVLWAANLGCLGFHPWPYRADDPDNTDELRIDLDPSPGVTFPMVQEAATEVRRFLDEHGITSFIKTTGNRGLHVYVRVEPGWDSFGTRQAAVAVARALAAARPDLITDKWWKEERGARVFIDFNQNAPHKTVFGAWCVRARPGAQVSAPFAWDELPAHPPRRPDRAHGPRATRRRRRSVGGHRRRAAVDRPARRALRARPRQRHPRRTVAAGVPEDARRGPPGEPQPGPPRHGVAQPRSPSIAAMSPNDPSPWQPPNPGSHAAPAASAQPAGSAATTSGPLRRAGRISGATYGVPPPVVRTDAAATSGDTDRRRADGRRRGHRRRRVLPALARGARRVDQRLRRGPRRRRPRPRADLLRRSSCSAWASPRSRPSGSSRSPSSASSPPPSACRRRRPAGPTTATSPTSSASDIGAGLVVVVVGSLIALAGAIVTTAKRRR